MITFESGNLLQKKQVDAQVNPVNCVGVMGKGLALQFRHQYPEAYQLYLLACQTKELRPGRVHIVHREDGTLPRYIVHFPTKRHWRDRSLLEDIQSGLLDLQRQIKRLGIRSIGIPALGCGNGGLEWDVVRDLLLTSCASNPSVSFHIFSPQ